MHKMRNIQIARKKKLFTNDDLEVYIKRNLCFVYAKKI